MPFSAGKIYQSYNQIENGIYKNTFFVLANILAEGDQLQGASTFKIPLKGTFKVREQM